MFRKSFYAVLLSALVCGLLLLAGGCESLDKTASSTTQPAVTTTEQPTTTTGQPTPATTTEPVALGEDGWLLGMVLPSSVPAVMERLGDPDNIILPDLMKDPSPWPQQFQWVVRDDYTFSVLAEAYSDTTPDYEANIYCIVLRRDADVASPEVIDGMSLGITNRTEVEMSFGDQVTYSCIAERWEFDDTGTYVSSLSREQDGTYTFYMFDEDDVLVGLAQATYDLGGVD